MRIHLVLPAVSKDEVSTAMARLTKAIDKAGHGHAVQGALGGEWGYGARFTNAVFEMRPFYWGDCTCGYADDETEAMRGHAPTCEVEQPNFRHLATDYQVRWYKYIGRGMEISNPGNADFKAILRECLKSL